MCILPSLQSPYYKPKKFLEQNIPPFASKNDIHQHFFNCIPVCTDDILVMELEWAVLSSTMVTIERVYSVLQDYFSSDYTSAIRT